MTTEGEFKVVQFFLTGDDDLPAIYEVRLFRESKSLACTCPGYKGKSSCKHIKFVKSRIVSGDLHNHYVLRLDGDTPESVIDGVASMSPTQYRDFVVRYGMIEVL